MAILQSEGENINVNARLNKARAVFLQLHDVQRPSTYGYTSEVYLSNFSTQMRNLFLLFMVTKSVSTPRVREQDTSDFEFSDWKTEH